MFALGDKNRSVRVNPLSLNDKGDIAEVWVIEQTSHVLN
jgi:hypothetical protein